MRALIKYLCGIMNYSVSVHQCVLQSGADIASFICAFRYFIIPVDEVVRLSDSTGFPFGNCGSMF